MVCSLGLTTLPMLAADWLSAWDDEGMIGWQLSRVLESTPPTQLACSAPGEDGEYGDASYEQEGCKDGKGDKKIFIFM